MVFNLLVITFFFLILKIAKPRKPVVQDNNKFTTAMPKSATDSTVPIDTVRPGSTNNSKFEQTSKITTSRETLINASPIFVNIDGPSPTSDPTKGVIPALIILSVLAVPIIFLLCISIVLRVRAYRRERFRRVTFGEVGMKGDLAVSRSRGWCSYLNCCNKRSYGFDKVTLNDFYSDSDSEGIWIQSFPICVNFISHFSGNDFILKISDILVSPR